MKDLEEATINAEVIFQVTKCMWEWAHYTEETQQEACECQLRDMKL